MAEKIGLIIGDKIEKINDVELTNMAHASRLIKESSDNMSILKLRCFRGEIPFDLVVNFKEKGQNLV